MPAESLPPTNTRQSESDPSTVNPTGGDDSTDRGERLPLDEVFDLLRVERRRFVLQYLQRDAGRVTLGELSEHVASRENDKPESAVTSKERKRVYVGLYQNHLPRMDDAGVVEFEVDRKIVELGPRAEQLRPYLELEDGSGDRRWAPYYLVTAVVGGLLLLLETFLVPIAWLSTVLLDGVLLTLFGVSLAHVYDEGLPGLDALCR